MTLLWENAATDSAFSSQTLSINSSDYQMIFMEYINEVSDQTYGNCMKSCFLHKGKNEIFSLGAKAHTFASRHVTISDTELIFTGGYYCDGFGDNSRGSQDKINIPIRIYGVKQ